MLPDTICQAFEGGTYQLLAVGEYTGQPEARDEVKSASDEAKSADVPFPTNLQD